MAERDEIAARHAEFELIGPPEIREIASDGHYFTPFADQAPRNELPLDMQPAIDAAERFVALLFLRRYVTYCARRRRFAAMNGAALLYRDVAAQ